MSSHFHHLEQHEGDPFGPELVLRGSRERFPSVLMTALTTILILVPTLFLGDIPGLEIVRPMTVVILGGLVTTLLLDLFILPALYLKYAANREPELSFVQVPAADLPATAIELHGTAED
jgi:Cu/Ag efflux pump CusA